MTHQEILEKAIHKAIDGGWKFRGYKRPQDLLDEIADTNMHKDLGSAEYSVIFNHDFAKALWGESTPGPDDNYRGGWVRGIDWRDHLRHMVIAEDPIAYLGENL